MTLENFISRSQWGARPPKSRSSSIWPHGSTCHYEGPTMGTFAHSTCAGRVRAIQSFHMDQRGWADIAYNAVVCPHGYIFEGRWLHTRSAAQGTNDGNAYSYAICYLGGAGDPFTNEAKHAFWSCITYFRESGAGNEVKKHSDWHSTSCPGSLVAAWVDAGCPVDTPVPPIPPVPPPPAMSVRDKIFYNPTLREGSAGQYVRIAQGFLLAHAGDLTGRQQSFVDGVFGPGTKQVLTTWQSRCSPPLGATGYVDGDDWQWWIGEPPVLSKGSLGPYVYILQGLMVAHSATPITIDGVFGSQTESSLRAWQERTGRLNPDGICGVATWNWLAGTA